jgi:hypothetical protein
MADDFKAHTKESPTGDVEYDEEALRQAAERMHATGTGHDDQADPDGGHDPRALRDAAEKMGVKGDA